MSIDNRPEPGSREPDPSPANPRRWSDDEVRGLVDRLVERNEIPLLPERIAESGRVPLWSAMCVAIEHLTLSCKLTRQQVKQAEYVIHEFADLPADLLRLLTRQGIKTMRQNLRRSGGTLNGHIQETVDEYSRFLKEEGFLSLRLTGPAESLIEAFARQSKASLVAVAKGIAAFLADETARGEMRAGSTQAVRLVCVRDVRRALQSLWKTNGNPSC